MERVQFTAGADVLLDGDLALADDPRSAPVILCHPHPDFGGDRFHPLITAAFDAAVEHHRSVLRFDFRRHGGPRPHADLAAALDFMAEAEGTGSIDVIGYSFGAEAALTIADRRIASIVAIAPPSIPAADPGVPVLVLVPEHDQFCPQDVVRAGCQHWNDVTVETITSTDHFLGGRMGVVVDLAMTWLDRPVER